jgi:hypothetical protein
VAQPTAHPNRLVSTAFRAYLFNPEIFGFGQHVPTGECLDLLGHPFVEHRCPIHLQILVPKILQGALAAVTDIYLAEITSKLLGERYRHASVSLRATKARVYSHLHADYRLYDILLPRLVFITNIVQLIRDIAHNGCVQLLSLALTHAR